MELRKSELFFQEEGGWSNGWSTGSAPSASGSESESVMPAPIPPVMEKPAPMPIPPVMEKPVPLPMPPVVEAPMPIAPIVELPLSVTNPQSTKQAHPSPPTPEHLPEPEAECGYCITVAMAYVPTQEWTQLFTPEEGFSRGTLFRELDLPFSGKGGSPND